jgi:hypothetical protein
MSAPIVNCAICGIPSYMESSQRPQLGDAGWCYRSLVENNYLDPRIQGHPILECYKRGFERLDKLQTRMKLEQKKYPEVNGQINVFLLETLLLQGGYTAPPDTDRNMVTLTNLRNFVEKDCFRRAAVMLRDCLNCNVTVLTNEELVNAMFNMSPR